MGTSRHIGDARLRTKREKEGKCIRCGKKKESDYYKHCDSCREYMRKWWNANRDRVNQERRSKVK